MSSENVEIVRRAYAEFERGNFWLPDLFDPGIRVVWLSALAAGEAESVGLDDMIRVIKDWLRSWDHATMKAEEFIDAGENVVVIAAWRARGKASGIDTEWPHAAVWTMHNGKAIRLTTYNDPADALEAVGLRDQTERGERT